MGRCSKEILRLYREGKVSDATLIKMAAFKEELEKKALNTPIKAPKSLSGIAAILLTGAALGVGGFLGKSGVDAIVNKLDEKNRDPLFREMLRIHPELKLEDRKKVRNYFDTVWHFAPHMAKNPFAVGAYIRQAVLLDASTGGPPITQTKELADIQKAHIQARDKGDTLADTIFKPMFLTSEEMKVKPDDIDFFPQTTRTDN